MAKKDEDNDADEKPKGGKLKLIIGAVLLLGVGAGGVYGAMAAGLLGPTAAAAEPQGPALVLKGEDDPYAPPSDSKDAAADAAVFGEGGSKYRTAYFRFENSFTSNFADSTGIIQVSLATSTQRDGRVLQWLKRHELAVRSAILVELAATPEEDAFSADGKERMSKRLTQAINKVLEEKEGFGGVDAVYFEQFLVQ
ncbi:flagellar basal body-associated FliL family protein [Erythrobacter sp. HA6-11]